MSLLEETGGAPPGRRWASRAEADPALADALLDDLLEPLEGAAADEQDVAGVDLDVFLVRVLAAALRRDVGDGALDDLQERLLHALAGDVAGDRRVVGLARDLVDLVDVDDAALGALDVEVGGLDEAQQDVLDVLADVAGLGQAVASAMEKGTSRSLASVWASRVLPQPVGPTSRMLLLPSSTSSTRLAGVDPLVVVVDGDGEDLLGLRPGR